MKKITIIVLVSILLFQFCRKEPQVSETTHDKDVPTPIKVFQTANETNDRLTEKSNLEFTEIPSERFNDNRLPSILLDDSKKFQIVLGFGGAFTEAGAVTYFKLSPQNRQKIIKAYFDPCVSQCVIFFLSMNVCLSHCVCVCIIVCLPQCC